MYINNRQQKQQQQIIIMKRQRSEISSHNHEPPTINHISNQVQTTPSYILNKRLDEAKMEFEKQEKEEKEREEKEKRLESLPSLYNRNTFSIIYAHLEGVIFILSFLFFKLKPWTANYRRRRRLSVRFFLLLFLLIKLFSFWCQNSAQAVQFLQQDQQQQQEDQLQLQTAFFEPPQSLVYSHESGSGEGQYPQPNSNFRLSSPDSSSSLSSSSISPSLITAKCWNNYENDNDCKQINVITANNANDQQFDQNNNNDDSLITPIVIFESSSTIEPSNKPPTFLAPPYFSSTFRPDSDNVVLARHRTPPTSNDPAYSATPPAATILSPDFPPEITQKNVYNWQPTAATTTYPTYTSQRANKWRHSNNFDGTQVVTMPATSVFVATPQPKKALKTTTLGRKCRDENDEDCDEPDDNDDGDDDNDNSNGDNDNDRPNNRGKFKNNNNRSNSLDKTTGNSNDVDNDDSPDDGDSNNENKQVGGQDSTETSNEIGSGDGPRDDNEDDDGDDDSEDVSDGSGNSEPTLINQTQKFVEVTPYSTPSQSYNNENLDSSSSVKPGAEIEVVVHPTLPPTFPIATTSMTSPPNYDNSQDIYSSNYSNSYDFQTSTIMPDDTYTSKPVFPTSTSSESSSEDSIKKNQSGSGEDESEKSSATTDPNQLAGGGTSTEMDLATFKPIPMPPPVDSQERWSNQGNTNNKFHDLKNSQSTDGSTLESDINKIADKNKFDPTDAAPIKFDNPWRAQPISKPSFGQTTDQQQQSQQEPYSRQRPPSRHRPDLRASSKNHDLNSPVNSSRIQSDILPAMLLYASIVILVVTALIFVIMAFAFWRRNTARQRALMHKTQQQILNGSAGSNQVVGSMSHGSQLMANIQQPGLLSTYGPGKGLTMGKVTSSIMRGGENEMDNMIGEEDESNPMLAFGEQSKGNQSLDGSGNNNLRDRNQAINNQNNGDVGLRASSWSTDQDQTTTATTTTTSSGSQKTDLGRGEQQTNGGHNLVTNQSRPQYPNSLSDGRQNSSSISDSQCSPDEMRQQTSQSQFPPVDQNYQQHQIHQGQQGPNFLNSHNQAMSSPHGIGSNVTHGQAIYNQQSHSVIPDGVKLQQQQQLKNKHQQQFVSSRSVENLARNDGYGLDGGPCEPHVPFHHHQQQQHPPYLTQPSQGRLINHQMLPPGQQPNLHGIPPFKPAAMLPPNLNIQRAYLSNSPGAQGTSLDGNNPNQQHINGGNVRLTNGQYPPQQPVQINPDFTIFSAPNVNMAKVAMNPLATLGRRYPAGMGLNRNIYSEDSSSLMTASPSLARTSSSLSFAFSANNQPSTPSIRAKPIVDASGRIFNDYTQVSYNNGNSNNGAPPVLGRKDRSEAWYV